MVDVTLSEGVGRRQEEKVAASTLMWFVLGPVGFAGSRLPRVYLRTAQVSSTFCVHVGLPSQQTTFSSIPTRLCRPRGPVQPSGINKLCRSYL